MASIRKLKKDINYLAYELLTEAFTFKHFHPGIDDDRFDAIIKDLVKLRNELISKLNNPALREDAFNAPAYFREVREDMVKLVALLDGLDEK
jgi:hypothetical protein